MRMLRMSLWEMTGKLYCWNNKGKRVRLILLGSTLIWACMEMLGKKVTEWEGILKHLTIHSLVEESIRMRESSRCHKGFWCLIWRKRLGLTHSLIDLSVKKLIRQSWKIDKIWVVVRTLPSPVLTLSSWKNWINNRGTRPWPRITRRRCLSRIIQTRGYPGWTSSTAKTRALDRRNRVMMMLWHNGRI